MTAPVDSIFSTQVSISPSLSANNLLLSAIIKLTAQREQETLALALIEATLGLSDSLNATLYDLGGELGNVFAKIIASSDPKETISSHIKLRDFHIDMSECVETQQTITSSGNQGYQICHPVIEQDTVVGLLVRQQHSNDDLNNELIDGLLSIYANQHSLLNRQQRDGLTGLYNRVALQNWMKRTSSAEVHTDRRENAEESIGCFAIFDIDHFKRINDNFGHLYGDEVLLIFADLMRQSFRHNDLLFRYGGEEFVAILKDTDLDASLAVLERFREAIATNNFPQINQVTVTVGVTEIEANILPTTLIDRADKALYFGKNNGRDQVNSYELLKEGHTFMATTNHPHNIELFNNR